MARTEADILEEILNLAPGWMQHPGEVHEAVLRVVASIFSAVETMQEELFQQTFVRRASGLWLDAHGAERQTIRLEDEDDEAYRARILEFEDQVTRPALRTALEAAALVTPVEILEYLDDGGWATESGVDPAMFADESRVFEERVGFLVVVPEQLPRTNDTAWAIEAGTSIESFAVDSTGAGSWPDDPGMFADALRPSRSDVYGELARIIIGSKAGGVPYSVLVEGS